MEGLTHLLGSSGPSSATSAMDGLTNVGGRASAASRGPLIQEAFSSNPTPSAPASNAKHFPASASAPPAGPAGSAGSAGSAAVEKEMEAYADFLDELKETDPARYVEIMTQLAGQIPGGPSDAGAQSAAQVAADGVKMPGADGKVMGKEGGVKDVDPGTKIVPDAGFVIKTVDGDGVKAFINVCR